MPLADWSSMTDALSDFLDGCDDEGLGDVDVIVAARAAGFDLAVIVGALLERSTMHDQEPLRALVEVCGIREARAVFVRIDPAALDDDDLDALLRLNADANRLRAAIADEHAPLAAVVATITPALSSSQRAHAIDRLVRRTTPGDAARFFVDNADDDVARAVARGVSARVALLDAVPSLLSSSLSPMQLTAVIARFYDVVVDGTLPADLFAIDAHAAALAALARDVRAAIPSAPTSTAWVAVLRRRGLRASAAVLHFLEAAPAPSLSAIAAILVDAGYGDELLPGFIENGCGTHRSLTTLAQHGWHVDTMVKALLAQGLLASEVRDELLALQLPRAAVVDVLLRHVPADVVALVMPS